MEQDPQRISGPQFWPAVPSIVMFVFGLIVIVLFKPQLSSLLTAADHRLRAGGSIKVGSFEFSDIRVNPQTPLTHSHDGNITVRREDEKKPLANARDAYYKD